MYDIDVIVSKRPTVFFRSKREHISFNRDCVYDNNHLKPRADPEGYRTP